MQVHTHRVGRQAGLLGNLFSAQPLDELEHQRLAIRVRRVVLMISRAPGWPRPVRNQWRPALPSAARRGVRGAEDCQSFGCVRSQQPRSDAFAVHRAPAARARSKHVLHGIVDLDKRPWAINTPCTIGAKPSNRRAKARQSPAAGSIEIDLVRARRWPHGPAVNGPRTPTQGSWRPLREQRPAFLLHGVRVSGGQHDAGVNDGGRRAAGRMAHRSRARRSHR